MDKTASREKNIQGNTYFFLLVRRTTQSYSQVGNILLKKNNYFY